MRRLFAVIVVVIGVGLAVWRCSRSDTPRTSNATAEHAKGSARAGMRTSTDRPLPTWFVQRGAPARKIAGHVTRGGAPVKDAIVTLQSMLTRARVNRQAQLLEFEG